MTKHEVYNELIINPVVCYDLFNSFLGNYLGKGYSRYVFEYGPDIKKWVVKIDYNSRGSNFMEYEIWNTVKDTKFAKWFAPCLYISPDGKVLIQRKVKELEWYNTLPKKVPIFFHDVVEDNFGTINGKVVCFDYALSNLLKTGLTNEMQETTWNFRRSCSIA